MEFFQENWLPVLVAVYLTGMVLYGHYRGFIRLAVSLTALIITLIAVKVALPYVTDFIQENTSISSAIGQEILETIGLGEEEDPQEPDLLMQQQLIQQLNLPESIKEELINNNNHEIYQLFGVDALADYIAAYLSDMVIQAVCFTVLFIIIFVLIQIGVRWLDLIARLPVLYGINHLAGALLGGILGLLYFWIGCLALSIFAGTTPGVAIINQIEGCGWLSALYHNNLLGIFVLGIIRGIF